MDEQLFRGLCKKVGWNPALVSLAKYWQTLIRKNNSKILLAMHVSPYLNEITIKKRW